MDIHSIEYRQKLRWCKQNGWSEPFCEGGVWYAFPPGGVMANKIPRQPVDLVFFFVRPIMPEKVPNLPKKLQDFVDFYLGNDRIRSHRIVKKIDIGGGSFMAGKQQKKAEEYASLTISSFSKLEKLQLEEYLKKRVWKLKETSLTIGLLFAYLLHIGFDVRGFWVMIFTSFFFQIVIYNSIFFVEKSELNLMLANLNKLESNHHEYE